MLDTKDNWAIVARLVEIMRGTESWAGETHIQKTLFFVERLLNVPSSYQFVLYKHGPYSFDLHDDLGAMRANLIVEIKLHSPYGASFGLGRFGQRAIRRSEAVVARYEKQLRFVSEHVGRENIRTLERYSTALYVKTSNPEATESRLRDEIVRLKPHISTELALAAINAVAKIEDEARAKGLILDSGAP